MESNRRHAVRCYFSAGTSHAQALSATHGFGMITYEGGHVDDAGPFQLLVERRHHATDEGVDVDALRTAVESVGGKIDDDRQYLLSVVDDLGTVIVQETFGSLTRDQVSSIYAMASEPQEDDVSGPA